MWVGGCLVQVQATADLYLHRTHSNTTGHTQTFNIILKVKVKLLSRIRLFVTPTDCSLPGSSVHGIFQARILEWVAISFSRNIREGTQSHSLTDNWIKDLLSMAPHIRARLSFPLSQSLPSGSFHRPLILIHQRAKRMKTTITEN